MKLIPVISCILIKMPRSESSSDSSEKYSSCIIDNVAIHNDIDIFNSPIIFEFTNVQPTEETFELIQSLPQLYIHEEENKSYILVMKYCKTITMLKITKQDIPLFLEVNKKSTILQDANKDFVSKW